ncbi:MAG: alpha/beta hydrolase [Candidatus Sericytochromatia bacterium]|nr:alpha/beta hydrolase [Candidatus Sericytochromatia bacterium]
MDLSVHESGPADAPTLLFVHGGGMSRWMWEPQLAQFSDYHCLVPDLPGHGESAAIPFVSIADCADRLVALIRAKAHRKVATVIGLSLGSQILLALMARYPGRVGRALLSGTLTQPVPGGALLDVGMRAYGPLKNWPCLVRANMRRLGIPDAYYPQWAADTRRTRTRTLARVMAENLRFAPPERLDDVAVPSLLLTGETENPLLQRAAEDLAGRLRNARSGVVQGVGHAWNLAAPELFSDSLRAWLTGSPLPDRITHLTALKTLDVRIGPPETAAVEEDDEDWWEDSQGG